MTLQQRAQAAQQRAGQRDLKGALALIEAAPPEQYDGLLDLRIGLLKAMERPEEVAVCRRRQVEQKPGSVVAHHNLASALGDAGQHEQALHHVRQAMALGGDAPETWIVLARSLQALQHYDQAVDAFRQVLKRRSDYVEAVTELAQAIWLMGGDVAEARQPHLDALAKHPAHPQLLRGLATFNEYVGMDPRENWRDLTERAQKALAHSAAIEAVAAHLALKFDPALALQHAERAVDMAGQDVAAWTMLAQCLLINDRAAEALDILPQLIQAVPDDQSLLAYHATAMRILGRADPLGLDDGEALIRAATIDTPEGWDSLPAYLADLKIALERQHSYVRHPIGQSLRHGTQTPVDLRRVDDPVIQAFFTAIDGPIRQYLSALGQGADPVRRRNTGDYRLSGCWSVRLGSGGFHEHHIHPKGWLSSACYIDLPEAVDRGHEGWIGFGVPPFHLSRPLEPLKLEKPTPGKLVLFPSCMWHGTMPFEDPRPRLTIAFDVVPD